MTMADEKNTGVGISADVTDDPKAEEAQSTEIEQEEDEERI